MIRAKVRMSRTGEGVAASGPVSVIAADRNGDVVTLTYEGAEGELKRRLVTVADAEGFEVASSQRWTFDAYMRKKLVRGKPLSHVRIFFKNLAHLTGLAPA